MQIQAQTAGVCCAPAPVAIGHAPSQAPSRAVWRPESHTIAQPEPMLHSLNAVVEQWRVTAAGWGVAVKELDDSRHCLDAMGPPNLALTVPGWALGTTGLRCWA